MKKTKIIPRKGKYQNLVRDKLTILAILDGWGIGPKDDTNAIWLAKTPVFDALSEKYPYCELAAHGNAVGLDSHQVSGSETGHMNIGAGRIVEQDSRRISESINAGTFFHNAAYLGAISHVKKNKSNLHLMGLLGNEDSPHMNPYHLEALLLLAKKSGIENVYVHFFTDGRDSYPKSAPKHLAVWEKNLKHIGVGKIATLVGRFWAMDRAKNWNRLKKAYQLIVNSKEKKFASARKAVKYAYKNKLTDEYIGPSVILSEARLKNNDAIIHFNLRSDRARQFSKLFVLDESKETTLPKPRLKNLYFVAMTNFGPDLPVHTAFQDHPINGTLPTALGDFSQLYIAETEKFSHITYFLNGGCADSLNGEERVMIPSPVVNSYAKIPQMAAPEITRRVLGYLKKSRFDFIAINFANADMVGHTGDMKAAIRAIEAVDECLGKLYKQLEKQGGNLIITADHGNADCMWDTRAKLPMTFHTKNPVPFFLASERFKREKLSSGGMIGNIAPTLCDIMETDKLREMKLKSLL